MVQRKADIETFLQENRGAIAGFGVAALGLFGSFARGEASEASDIDLLVEFEPRQKTFDNFMGLAFYLEDHLQRKVDLVTRESLSPHLGPSILQEVEYLAL
ncbi:MAG: nucleotidyltransferase family protein [Spirochaetales bacterium]